jgi:hypothetical protein
MPISGAFPGGLAAYGGPGAQAGVPAPGTESNREDLLDLYINLDMNKKAAVFLAAPKTEANGMNHELLIDSLPATSTAGTIEGADWSSAAVAARTRISNAVQTFTYGFAVSKDQIEYSLKGRSPGISNEYENQVNRHLLALGQSVDARAVALGTSVATVSASATNATTLFGTPRAWYASGSNAQGSVVTSTVASGGGSGVTKVNVSGAWSRSYFLALHEAMFSLGADPDTLAVDPGVKTDITLDVLGEVASASSAASAMMPAVVRQQYVQTNNSEFAQDIQFMRTPFGRIAVLVDRFIPSSAATVTNAVGGAAAFLYERARLRFAFWRPMRHYSLPPSGDSVRGYVHCGVTLELLHPQTIGVLYNLTT